LTELIERYQDYRARTPAKGVQANHASVRSNATWDANDTMRSDWNFDTVKSMAAMGTFRATINDLNPPNGMIFEDDEEFYETDGHDQDSFDTDAATKGSDAIPTPSLGMNADASHSTMVIKNPLSLRGQEAVLEDPPAGAPPAYSGSVRSTRRASYAARTSTEGSGTVLTQADLGSGTDTIRPVKKVDPAGSLRLSSEFVGSIRKENSNGGSSPRTSPTHKRATSEMAKAGRSMVDEVILPILTKTIHDDMDAREIESLSMLQRGFADLREANPELAYNVMLDILQGINE
jgi:serine/threonine-protein kinase 24/25/MST4